MRNIYTFVTYLLFSFFIQKIICLDLNIGNITNYSTGSTDVTVKKITEIQNLYTHEFSSPITLTEIYNGNKKIYFDPLLVKDQLLLSASVIWLFRKPSVIQLNLEKSSVLLLNESDSLLGVQAIFSEKLVTNLSPRIHSTTEVTVDVDLSKFKDYDNNNSNIYVTDLEFSEDRFKRYTLRNYNLESTKLGKILYKDTELKTKTENDSQATTESNLVIPYKDNIYSILVYSYNNFPLLLEVLYTFNRRQFYGYTAEKKWHHVLFPAFHDPSFRDFLYNKLNYYACKNGFKYTLDIDQKTEATDHSYKIDNYCIGSEGVETVVNNLKLAFYIDEKSKEPKHRCFEHTPSDDNKFFTDHLMVGTSLLKLPNTPNIIKCSRVYYQSNLKPHLIVLVDNSDVLHYYINRNEVWNEHKKETKVQFNERFNESIRAALENVAPTVQADRGSIVVLTNRKTSYNKEQITNELKNNLSSDFFDNEITVKENTEDKGSCLAGAGYKVYMHDLSSAASIFSHSSGSNVHLHFYVSNTKIGLYESKSVNSNPLSLSYNKQNSLYVYFYREYPKALAACYNGKLYRPLNLEEYRKKWVNVDKINDCCCKSGNNQPNNKALSVALLNAIELFNLVNPYEPARDKKEYENSSLFFEYTHGGSNSESALNIEVCKKLDCGKILNLSNDNNDSKSPLDKALVYFNRFDTNHEKPLMISLHFKNSNENRFYSPSEVHDSSDADSSKPLTGLTKYTNHSDFVDALLEKNDTLHNSVTYQIHEKENYKNKRVNVTKEGDTVSKLNSNGFAKYVHSPTSGNTDKKSFILNRSNILKTWSTTKETYEPLDNIQNVVCKDVTVYFSTGLDIPLLVSLSKKDGVIDYYYIVKKGSMTFWNHLDIPNYQKLVDETIKKEDKIHDKLIATNYDKLLDLLKKIEASLINAVIVLLSKQYTYDKAEMERGLRRSYPKPIDVTELSESQPDSITVTRQDYSNLKSLKFECYIQKINPIGPFKTDLRIMVPTYEDYRNVLLHRTEPDVNYRSKIIFDLDQRGHRTYYDAEQYYMFVQKKEFNSPPYLRYAHTCHSCGNWLKTEFAIKFAGIRVTFYNDLPETTHKRIDVYFHKSYPEKFSTVVFHQPGSNNPRYFGYSNFVEYHKNNKVINLSSLSEFNHKYEDNINIEFKKVLEVEYPKMQKIHYLSTEYLLYEKDQTDLYVYFEASYVGPMMFCYHNKAYIPSSRDNYYGEWVQVREIKSCKYEGENEKTIFNVISYIYMSLNTDDRKIIRNRWDYNGDNDAIQTLPDNLSILTLVNAQITISTIHKDKIKNPNRIQKLEIDLYYFNNDSTYVQFSGDLTKNLIITTRTNNGFDVIKFYKIVIMALTGGSYVHRIEYIRDTPTDEVTINLYTNTLFVYTFRRKYDDWYKSFNFVGISRIKPLQHAKAVDDYYEKIRALNRNNFFITRILKLT